MGVRSTTRIQELLKRTNYPVLEPKSSEAQIKQMQKREEIRKRMAAEKQLAI